MILIADSGSTKTSWRLTDNQCVISDIRSAGINPYFQSEEEISKEIAAVVPHLKAGVHQVEAIWFYGAGCAFDKIEVVRNAIRKHFKTPQIEVGSDLLGAARGLCGQEAGIACILGTGSNSCFYNGSEIEQHVPPLGFILGDEGSGAVLGKHFVGDLLKDRLPATLKDQFLTQLGLTPAQIMDNVYRQPFPNRFLADLSPFLAQHIHEPEIHDLVFTGFRSFFERNVKKYDYKNYRTNVTGSIAYHYKEILLEAATASDVSIGHIMQSPIEGLVMYHCL